MYDFKPLALLVAAWGRLVLALVFRIEEMVRREVIEPVRKAGMALRVVNRLTRGGILKTTL